MIVAVLAAGESKRFGQTKQLKFLPQVLESLPPFEVFIITGHDRKAVEGLAQAGKFHCRYNTEFSKGMGTSVKCAAELAIEKKQDLLITLADLPKVSFEDYEALIKAFKGKTLFARFDQTYGAPAIISKNDLPKLLELNDDLGAKAVINEFETYPLPSASADVDYPG